MYKIFISLLLILLTSCSSKYSDEEKKEVSECLGDILWKDLNKNFIDYDLEIVIDTIKKNATGKRVPQQKPQTILSKHIEKLYEKKI